MIDDNDQPGVSGTQKQSTIDYQKSKVKRDARDSYPSSSGSMRPTTVGRISPQLKRVQNEARKLIDGVLEDSIQMVDQRRHQRETEVLHETERHDDNNVDLLNNELVNNNNNNNAIFMASAQHDGNSESENYAITCDDIEGGLAVVKSPTIESISGRSFDDNMSYTDEVIGVGGAITTTSAHEALRDDTELSEEQHQRAVITQSAINTKGNSF